MISTYELVAQGFTTVTARLLDDTYEGVRVESAPDAEVYGVRGVIALLERVGNKLVILFADYRLIEIHLNTYLMIQVG